MTMRPKIFLTRRQQPIVLGLSLSLFFLLSSLMLSAQTPMDFSGNWEYDKVSSSPDAVNSKFDGTVTRQIRQDTSTLTYNDSFFQKGSSGWKTSDEVYTLNGQEQIKKDETRSSRKSATWSPDKKNLTLSYAETYLEDGAYKSLLIEETYSLSADGKTLTINTYSRNQVSGESRTKSVFHRK